MKDLITREPVAVRAALGALIAAVCHLLIVFGLPIPAGIEDGLASAVDAVILVLVTFSARAKVTPTAAPQAVPETAPVELTAEPTDDEH